MVIALTGIKKSYTVGGQRQEVLRSLDLSIDKGELVSIMGQSGSGKSTLMNIMGLLDKPDEGHYKFCGDDVKDFSPDHMAHIRNERIGFVFQSFYLLGKLTALENVGLPLLYRGLDQAEIEDMSMSMLSRVGMDKWSNHKPTELSGGQMQRVAIARALVGKPSIVLADEPTGALDPKIGKDILKLFIDINVSQGSTLIIITHDMEVAQAMNRQIKLVDGEITQM